VSAATKRPAILIVASDTDLRFRIERSVPGDRRALAIAPADLAHGERFVDAGAAVVALGGETAADDLEALAPLRRLQASRKLVLLARDLDDDTLALALERLAPALLLPPEPSAAALRWALGRIDPAETGATSARDQHRPALALLGVSAAIRQVVDQIHQVAPTRIPVLVLGETGTGKELVARALHEASPRARKPFVAVNCSALTETLLEAELFGFKKGAFTGADRDHAGLFAQAHQGTLFLDELGDMPLSLQAKLLRVLETGEVRPIGSTESRQVDVRIVSATHCDLESAIATGAFRQDLYYRLNTVSIYVPPLRRRRVDVPFLAQHFAEEFGAEHARRAMLSEDFLDALAQRDFPGNVRELRNAVERAIAIAAPGEPVTADALETPAGAVPALFAIGTLRDRILQLEMQAIRSELERQGGNRTRVAEALGLTRFGLRKKMQRLGLA
jgi:transcriptional regulator with PAS, ATPase and Fis domain